MASRRSEDPLPPRAAKARLFVALDLPEAARVDLVAWRDRALGGIADLRLVAPEALHVTLVFLGHLDEEEIPRIAGALPRDAPVPKLRALGVKPAPPRRPRLFALDLADEDGRCGAIHAALSDALAALGVYEPEKRPFWPHVTLARVRKGARVGRAFNIPAPPAEPWRANAVTLYRSRLSSRGARYEPIECVPLG